MLLSRLVCLHIRPPPTSTPFPYTTLFRSIGMGVRTVDRGPGAGVAGAAPPVGAVGAAVPRREEHVGARRDEGAGDRSEEHTSELQSLTNLVCRLLLEKKKKERIDKHSNGH